MFPEKVSLKNTKNQNRYEVNFARTARYYKSAILEMQRLLNQHEQMNIKDTQLIFVTHMLLYN